MWSKSDYDVLLRFLRTRGVRDNTARAVLGILLLAQSPGDDRCDDLLQQIRQQRAALDTPLLLEILNAATSTQVAEVLWGPVGLHLSTATFSRLFADILTSAPTDETVYRVVGAAVDFLQFNPEAFSIPVDVVTRLLRSSHYDARIVGMKAMRHANIPVPFQVECVLQYLGSPDCGARELGLHVLGTLATRLGIGLLDELNVGQRHELQEALDELATVCDDGRCTAVRSCREVLFPFGNDGRHKDEG